MRTGFAMSVLWIFSGLLATMLRYAVVALWDFWTRTPHGYCLTVEPGWFTALNYGWLAVWGCVFFPLALAVWNPAPRRAP